MRIAGRPGASSILVALAICAAALASEASGFAATPPTLPAAQSVCVFAKQRPVPDVPPAGRGKTITLALGLQAVCDPFSRPLDVVLVIDRPPANVVEDFDWDALHGTLEAALRGLDLASKPSVRFGVVAASLELNAPARKAQLTNNTEQIIAGINNVAPMTTSLEIGIHEAVRMLDAVRSDQRPARQAILLVTSGSAEVSCDGLRSLASEVQSRGIVLVTAWSLNTPGEPRCLANLASDVRFNLSAWGWLFLQAKLEELVNARGAFSPIQQVDLVDVLSDSLQYVGGGNPYRLGAGGNALEWHLAWPVDGISLTYQARIVYCGSFRTSKQLGETNLISGTVHFESHFWPDLKDESISFDNPLIHVSCDAEAPTLTPAILATPTGTRPATPGGTASATVTMTPASTRTTTTPEATAMPTASQTPGTAPPTAPGPGTASPPAPGLTPTTTPIDAVPTVPASTATPTPPLSHRSVFLPVTYADACAGAIRRPLDLVLAVDVSGSMKAVDVPGFPRRFEAAQAIGAAIIERLTANDQVAVLAFAAPSAASGQPAFEWLNHLTFAHDTARTSVLRLPKRDGSRLDLALDEVGREISGGSARPGTARPLVVLVTDGDLNQARRADVLAAAAVLREQGAQIAAIGVGIDADAALLGAVTASPARVFLTRELGAGERLASLLAAAFACWRE